MCVWVLSEDKRDKSKTVASDIWHCDPSSVSLLDTEIVAIIRSHVSLQSAVLSPLHHTPSLLFLLALHRSNEIHVSTIVFRSPPSPLLTLTASIWVLDQVFWILLPVKLFNMKTEWWAWLVYSLWYVRSEISAYHHNIWRQDFLVMEGVGTGTDTMQNFKQPGVSFGPRRMRASKVIDMIIKYLVHWEQISLSLVVPSWRCPLWQ